MAQISICICTFRRPQGLHRVLDSIGRLQVPPGQAVEVLVVDNDPEASAQAKVEATRAGFPFELRYFCEARRGVGHARNRCVREAAGEWIAFLDDDEWAEPQWLTELWTCLHSGTYDGVFGPVLVSFEKEPPHGLVASGVFRRHQFATGTRLDWPDCASGNVIFRKKLFNDVGGFSPLFAQSGAEDSEFFCRCQRAAAVFVWCDSAVAHENIPPARMTRQWVRRRAYLAGHNYARLVAHHLGRLALGGVLLRGGAALGVFGTLTFLAWLRGDPRQLAYEAKVAGGLGKLMAVLSPPRTDYGARN